MLFQNPSASERIKQDLMQEVNAMMINRVTNYCFGALDLDYSQSEFTASDTDKLNQCCAKVFTALEKVSMRRKQGSPKYY